MAAQVAMKNVESSKFVAEQPPFVAKVAQALNVDEYAYIEVLIALIKERKKSIINQIETYFITTKVEAQSRAHMKSRSGKEYEAKMKVLNRKFSEKENKVNDVFNSFVIVEPSVINMGSKALGNFRQCVYGQTDSFRYAIKSHIFMVQELLSDLPKFLPVQQEGNDYINLLNQYYNLVQRLYK